MQSASTDAHCRHRIPRPFLPVASFPACTAIHPSSGGLMCRLSEGGARGAVRMAQGQVRGKLAGGAPGLGRADGRSCPVEKGCRCISEDEKVRHRGADEGVGKVDAVLSSRYFHGPPACQKRSNISSFTRASRTGPRNACSLSASPAPSGDASRRPRRRKARH